MDGDRFAWFVDVGRIVIAAHARRRSSATQSDNELIHKARAAGQPQLVCEVDVVPANPASLALHWRLGFVSISDAVLANGKQVRYLEK
nr:acetyltransferase [Xanthomonas vasicola]